MNNDPINYEQSEKIDIQQYINTLLKNKYYILTLTLLLTSISIVYVLSQPNLYTSQTVLVPTEGKSSAGSGASAMAALAGINLGGGGDLGVDQLFQLLKSDYEFNKAVIIKHKLNQLFDPYYIDQNLVFPKNKRTIYDFFHDIPTQPTKAKKYSENEIRKLFKTLTKIISISSSKEGTIRLTATFTDRFIAKKLLEIYLVEMSEHIKTMDLKNIDEQIQYYEQELLRAKNVDIRANIANTLSNLMNKKIPLQAGEFYMVKQLLKPKVPFKEDKIGPKRANMVILTFVASLILGIALVFLKDFLERSRNEEELDNVSF